ncbi:MAG: hypothetical protein B6D45_07860 [Ignavibacteriales bacterium UTCHB3]|nr:MAG: hypothetical protein B6D45_07860 [Ignavibacteriales bacterium UTCHB3]
MGEKLSSKMPIKVKTQHSLMIKFGALFFVLFFFLVSESYGQSEYSKKLFDLYRSGNTTELSALIPQKPAKIESDTTLYIRYLLTDDGEKGLEYLETIIKTYPRSIFAVAAYAGMYLYYTASDNFKKANNCIFAVENEFPGESIDYFFGDTPPNGDDD